MSNLNKNAACSVAQGKADIDVIKTKVYLTCLKKIPISVAQIAIASVIKEKMNIENPRNITKYSCLTLFLYKMICNLVL